MTNKRNISSLKNCYGCGICTAICPTKIIILQENSDGFYQPDIVDEEKCINCGLCLKVCAFNHKDVASDQLPISFYSGWSNDKEIRNECSSGGIGFEIGRHLIQTGYKACGVKYSPTKRRAEHFITSRTEGFRLSIGSKYIPSNTTPAIDSISKTTKYFVTGTPCQIDSFRRYIKHLHIESNFILLDFFCHGVPSLLLWDRYADELENKIGIPLTVTWRNKTTGWHDSWAITAVQPQFDNPSQSEKERTYFSRYSQGDLFFKFFLGNYCLNTCCYQSCKYKCTSSAADIRIGDFWGNKYSNENEGVNGIIAFTPRGKRVLNDIAQSSCSIFSEEEGSVLENQMVSCPSMPVVRTKILYKLATGTNLENIYKTIVKPYNLLCFPKRIINRICREFGLRKVFH